MSPADALDLLLRSYRRYYDVKILGVEPPFAAEAAFHSHDEQYFLVRSARLGEAESHEYVFFALTDTLTEELARRLDECAWSRGTARARPHANHRNTDVALVILAEHIEPGARTFIQNSKHYQSYRHTFQGWSHYQVIAQETSTGALTSNRRGKDLRRLFRNK